MRKPEEGEMLGVVAQLVGYDRAKVKCSDEKIRVCRIPGRMKKKVWVRDGDIVIVAPWDFQADTRGDIVYRYQREEVRRLKAEGYDVPS
ncbi:MAG: translation initiation factor aIF-1A [Candidatus Marsarchaeota archaeon]|nr:translation initiation factor aIF-1A [Candidatus Marsarchaeota archaeon]